MQLNKLLESLEKPPSAVLPPVESRQMPLDTAVEVTALAYDSRQVQPGGLFIAVLGCALRMEAELPSVRFARQRLPLVNGRILPVSTVGRDHPRGRGVDQWWHEPCMG